MSTERASGFVWRWVVVAAVLVLAGNAAPGSAALWKVVPGAKVAFSADGTKLALVARWEQGWHLFVVDEDGDGYRVLTGPGSLKEDSPPAKFDLRSHPLSIGRDGKTLVFGGQYLIRANGLGFRDIAEAYSMARSGQTAPVSQARLTGDGDSVFFLAGDPATLYRASVELSDIESLSDTLVDTFAVGESGEDYAFVSRNALHIHTAKYGTEEQALDDGPVREVGMAGSGKRIAVLADHLRVYDMIDEQWVTLSDIKAGSVSQISLDDVGRRVYFVQGDYAFWVSGAGSPAKRIVDRDEITSLSVTGDGSKVAFAADGSAWILDEDREEAPEVQTLDPRVRKGVHDFYETLGVLRDLAAELSGEEAPPREVGPEAPEEGFFGIETNTGWLLFRSSLAGFTLAIPPTWADEPSEDERVYSFASSDLRAMVRIEVLNEESLDPQQLALDQITDMTIKGTPQVTAVRSGGMDGIEVAAQGRLEKRDLTVRVRVFSGDGKTFILSGVARRAGGEAAIDEVVGVLESFETEPVRVP